MKIEEITEDLSSTAISPSIQDGTQAENADDLLFDALERSPAMAEMQGKSGAEILADLNKSPLFMTELEDNDAVEALKVLAYEGTPLEVATGFKERGNETFVIKKYKDAQEFYTQGINVLLLEVRKRQRGEKTEHPADPAEIKRQVALLEASLVNRAACNLELKNYRSCILDCASAIRINSKNVKAYYRSSKALLALDKITEADDSCARGLALDPENKSLLAVAQAIIKKNELVAARKKKELELAARKRQEEITLKAALKARGIRTRKTDQPPEMEDAKIQLVPDPADPASSLSFPAVLLYPLHLESDFIKAWGEMEPMGHHLDYILPVPWDKAHEYTPTGVECYMETISGGLIKVGRKVTLLKVLSTGNVEVVDEVVKVFVVPKAKAEAWITEFKRKKASEK
ncbi:hypothetical protein B0O99DRAFT_516693 [Bisporella sp. PMI_857]|nr:hypothetical protein B0O99DRAFT_516693 [Bisporella sp. PMI_857]